MLVTSGPLFKNTFILRRPRVVNFVDMIEIATMFNKTTFKDSQKAKRIRNYVIKFIDLLIFSETMLALAELIWCVTWSICFFYLLWVRYNSAKFPHCRMFDKTTQKVPSWIGLKKLVGTGPQDKTTTDCKWFSVWWMHTWSVKISITNATEWMINNTRGNN